MVDRCGHIRFAVARHQPGCTVRSQETISGHCGFSRTSGRSGAGLMARPLASTEELELAVPQCEKGVGSVILSVDSPQLIAGVRLQPFQIYPDDRGYFLEVCRIGTGLAAGFPPATTQTSAAVNYPGSIKAFHFHKHQTDCWTPVRGLL